MLLRQSLTYTLLLAFCAISGTAAPSTGPAPADSLYKAWYFSPNGVFGRQPLQHPKARHYVKITHPVSDEAIIQEFNPAGIVTATTRFYFKNGLLALSTETDRWGDTYDSAWFRPDGVDKFLVTERRRGVNPFLP